MRALLEAGLVDLLFANEEEAAALGRAWGSEEGGGGGGGQSACECGAAALDLEGAALAGQTAAAAHTPLGVIVSLGARGARALWWEGGEGLYRTLRAHTAPAPAGVDVQDTVGAGDAFAAGVLAGLLSGRGMEAALEVGCGAGGAAVAVAGADPGAGAMRAVGERLLCEQGVRSE